MRCRLFLQRAGKPTVTPKANALLQGELKILLGTGASPGAGPSCGDPDVAQHSIFRVERPRHMGVARGEQVAWPRVLTSGG